jgi:hypothetical protein
MDDVASSARAWPFLVARGRRRGYRTLLAPGFLVAAREHGILDDTVVPSDQEDQARVIEVATGAGRPLTVVHASHVVTSADVAEPGTGPAVSPPRDEHSRPLQLIYGFVCADGPIPEPQDEDLRMCRETALGVYRRFLGDEEGFAVEPSGEFAPRSLVVRRVTPSRGPAPVRPAGRRATPARRPASVPTGERIPDGRGSLLLVTAAVLIAVILLAMWLARPNAPVECQAAEPSSSSESQRPPGSPAPTKTACLPGWRKTADR